ncbi:MAG: hypothetical protein GXO93_04155 [FCB group bacterium]|nr:hypothetical protein [FCB group bacterium]
MKIKYVIIIVYLTCQPFGFLFANSFVDLAHEIKLPLPSSWQLSGDSDSYPFQIVNDKRNADLLIFKSIISKEGMITKTEELKKSVDNVIKDVVQTLPEGQLLTNTAYSEQKRVWFVLEFLSLDTLTNKKIYNRLKEVLYRHPDGYQILFTLWARAPQNESAGIHEDLRFMQSGFSYYGKAEDNVYPSPSSINWPLVVLLILLVILIYYFFKKRKLTKRINFSDENNFWRCECGRLNYSRYQTCRRCGKERNTSSVM